MTFLEKDLHALDVAQITHGRISSALSINNIFPITIFQVLYGDILLHWKDDQTIGSLDNTLGL